MVVRQIRWFPYIAPPVVERLQATLSLPLNDRGISDYIYTNNNIVAVPTTILIPTDSRIRQFHPFTY